VWQVVDLLIEEVKENNMMRGTEFDITQSINAQLPFFTCRNIFFDKEIQKDIQRYVYCKDLGVSPYDGSFEKHPALWIDKYFIIKQAFAKQESNEIAKAKRKNKNG
jgi:hypothetical protein